MALQNWRNTECKKRMDVMTAVGEVVGKRVKRLALTPLGTVYTHIHVSCQFHNHCILSTTHAGYVSDCFMCPRQHTHTHVTIVAKVQHSPHSRHVSFPFRAGDGSKLDEKTETVHSNFLRSAPA